MDELLHFGSNMASMTPSSRADVCRSLLAQQKGISGAGIQLHLMTGRLLSDACGDIGKILDGVDSTPMKNLSDEHLRWLVDVQTEALKRMGNLSKKTGSVEYRTKTVQCSPVSKKAKPESKKGAGKSLAEPQKGAVKSVAEPQQSDSKLLREKLEAIRSMEKKLDESSDGN